MKYNFTIFEDCLKELLLEMKQKISIDKIPVVTRFGLVSKNQKLYEENSEFKNFGLAIKLMRFSDNLVQNLPKSCALIEFLIRNSIVKIPKITDKDNKEVVDPSFEIYGPIIFTSSIFPILQTYLVKLNSFEYDALIGESIVNNFIEFCELKTERLHVFVPINYLASNFDEIKFDQDLSLKKMSDNDMNTVISSGSFNNTANGYFLNSCKYKLFSVIEYERGKRTSPEPEIFKKKCKDLVLSLRLSKSGYFYPFSLISHLEKDYDLDSFESNIITSSSFEVHPTNIFPNQFKIDDACVSLTKTYYNILQNPDLQSKLQHLEFGLNKFNQSFTRLNKEDKILDYAICLDSTLLYGESVSNSYKLMVRGVLLLSKSKYSRAVVKETIEKLTQARNEIVHRGKHLDIIFQEPIKIDNVLMSIPEYINHCAELTRETLVHYLNDIANNKFLKEINTNVDGMLTK